MANHVESRPCGLRAQAWWGDQLVAESTATVLVEAPGRPPALYFPCSDIRLDLVGPDMLWRVTHDTPEVGWLSDYAAFDHDRVRVELIDEMDGDDARDVTVKRFPTWGDASHLVDILDVRPDGEGSYVGVARSQERRPGIGRRRDTRRRLILSANGFGRLHHGHVGDARGNVRPGRTGARGTGFQHRGGGSSR